MPDRSIQPSRKSSYRPSHPSLPQLGLHARVDTPSPAPQNTRFCYSPITARSSSSIAWGLALVGWCHSCIVLILGTCLLISLAPNWREWRWGLYFFSTGSVSIQPSSHSSASLNPSNDFVNVGHPQSLNYSTSQPQTTHHWWLESPTSIGQSALFTCSALYFTLDLISLYFRGRISSSSKAQRVVLHHVLSIFGLVSCVVTGHDGPLVLVGLLLAEASSPPLHVLQLCRHASKSRFKLFPSASHASGWVRCIMRPLISLALSMDLSLLHVLAFLLTRLMLLQVVAHAVMPFAALMSTKVVATVLVLLSACQFLDLLPLLQGDSHEGSRWRQVQYELRHLQDEWNRQSLMDSDEMDPSQRRRKISKGGSGSNGSTSPRTTPTGSMDESNNGAPAAKRRIQFRT